MALSEDTDGSTAGDGADEKAPLLDSGKGPADDDPPTEITGGVSAPAPDPAPAPRPRPRPPAAIHRTAYLSSLGLTFLIAFLSYHAQYPGLLSSSGIDPVERVLPRAFPRAHRALVGGRRIDPDSLCELLCAAGAVLAAVVSSGIVQHGMMFVLLTSIYYFLVVLGGTFYTFQWDMLLLEAGTLTAACCAPWLRRNPLGRDGDSHNAVGSWPIRFLLFKLMFMSGVVKIQADCPTWLGLTALEYHFATQCLPGPLAWHAHQLHPLLLRLSVAATFVIEVPAPLLLIAPAAAARRFGAALQIALQVMIVLTGNYTFFNLLTVALCIPCLEGDGPGETWADRDGRTAGSARSRKRELIVSRAQLAACTAFLWWASAKMFRVELVKDAHNGAQRLNVTLAMSKDDCDKLIETTVPVAVPATFLFLAATGARCLISQKRRRPIVVIQVVICALCVGVTSIPLLSLTPSADYAGSYLFAPLWRSARAYRLFSGYGLFRRMTGVCRATRPNSTAAAAAADWGWAGMPPSVVARPEITLEGLFRGDDDDDDNSAERRWRELKFRWKPGDVTVRPRQVAPHMPRLDWRMWFAALGNYQSNPWLVRLVDKVLEGCPPVLNLLDEPELERAGPGRVSRVRAVLWHYDFTRIDTPWSRGIPNAARLSSGKVRVTGGERQADYGPPPPFLSEFMSWPRQYWVRSLVKQYIPPISAENQHPSVKQFLVNHGYKSTQCVRIEERCSQFSQGSSLVFFCGLANSIRMRNAVWLPVLLLGIWAAWNLWLKFGTNIKGKSVQAKDREAELKKEQ